MSIVNSAVLDFCSLISEPGTCADLYFPVSRAIVAGYMVQETGLLMSARHPGFGGRRNADGLEPLLDVAAFWASALCQLTRYDLRDECK